MSSIPWTRLIIKKNIEIDVKKIKWKLLIWIFLNKNKNNINNIDNFSLGKKGNPNIALILKAGEVNKNKIK